MHNKRRRVKLKMCVWSLKSTVKMRSPAHSAKTSSMGRSSKCDGNADVVDGCCCCAVQAIDVRKGRKCRMTRKRWGYWRQRQPAARDDGTQIWHEKWPYGSFVSQLQIDLKMPIFWHVLEESVEHNDFSE